MRKKTEEQFIEIIRGVRLYRDDIEYILDRFQKKSLSAKITDSTSIYESIDEVIKYKGNNPVELFIEGTDNKKQELVNIKIEKAKVTIFSMGSESMFTFGFEMKDFISSKIILFFKIPLFIIWILAMISLTFWAGLQKSWLIWLCISLLVIWILAHIHRITYNGLTLSRKHEYGFWKRNKDKIILGIITAILGSLVTLLIQWLIELKS